MFIIFIIISVVTFRKMSLTLNVDPLVYFSKQMSSFDKPA